MTDKEQIDQLCKAFFDLFTNTDGKVPDLDMIYRLCIPQAIIIKKEKQKESVYDLASFIEPRKKSSRTVHLLILKNGKPKKLQL